ncbi:glycosyltransferase family 2 protein [Cruoricaptor ignavus]|uniref:glycosyltransferase family 2 protein n=1 Tax=Cruoricaptor ignavus TaxID=1118202 RepID=UPI00370DD3C5
MRNKTITIVISSYKYGHLAAHCIESILSQTRLPDKILFVDDGVGDCFHLAQLYPHIDFTFRKKNLGIAENFDDMLKKVDTDYCMFLGADNWLKSNAVEEFLKHDMDIITYDIILTGELKDELTNSFPSEIQPYNGDLYWTRKMKHHGSMVYRTKIAQKFGYKKRDGATYSDEDWVLWDKMIEDGATVAYINEAFLFYRRHKENFNNYSKSISNNRKPNRGFFYKLKNWL